MGRKFYFLGTILSFAFLTFFLFLAIGTAVVRKHSEDLPDLTPVTGYAPQLTSKILDGKNEPLYQFGIQNREFIRYSDIPPMVINAFISAEDKNFWLHNGYDRVSIIKALLRNIQNSMDGNSSSLIGGSTITQQVVKNLVLSNERSLERKVKEALLAHKLENVMSKNDILEIYFNDIYMGDGVYGILAASKHYFNKPLELLRYHEAAFLAALPKAPSRYSKNENMALERREYVLRQMLMNDFISQSEFELFNNKDLPGKFNSLTEDISKDYGFIPYYVSSLMRQTNKIQESSDINIDNGIEIKSYQDPILQKKLNESLQNGLLDYMFRREKWASIDQNDEYYKVFNWNIGYIRKQGRGIYVHENSESELIELNKKSVNWLNKSVKNETKYLNKMVYFIKLDTGYAELRQVPQVQGAMVAMNPKNGSVLAISGGFSNLFSEFNRADMGKRQPGSLIKPFIYSTALENGWTPSSPILDSSISFDGSYENNSWRPDDSNKSDKGFVTLRSGLEYSRNTVTVRLFEDLGFKDFFKTTKRLDLYDELPRDFSIALGSKELSLLKIASAYASLASDGRKKEPTFIRNIVRDDNIIWRHKYTQNQDPIFDSVTLAQIRSMLKGVTEYGTAWRVFEDFEYDVYGKTGTTNQSKDTWFIGFTENMLVGSFVGYDNPKPLGKGEYGGTTAAPMVKDFLQKIDQSYLKSDYTFPDAAKIVEIDPDTGVPTPGGFPEILRK